MSHRKRRSNRLTVEQLAEKRELRERELNQAVIVIGYSFAHLELADAVEANGYRNVALRTALEMVKTNDAERLELATANGRIVLFRELTPSAASNYNLPMMPNAKSADALLEYIESGRTSTRATNVIMFPFEGCRKAPLAGGRISDVDRQRAARLLGFRSSPAGNSRRDTRVLRNELPAAA